MTAEYALRSHLDASTQLRVSSAGTMDAPGAVPRADVKAYLLSRGVDVSAHQRRTVTAELVSAANIVISMTSEHQRILDESFGARSVLFTQACGISGHLPILDVDDVFPPHLRQREPARAHIYATIDRILELTPLLAEQLLSQCEGAGR